MSLDTRGRESALQFDGAQPSDMGGCAARP
jgi:hypothetical protein